MTCVRVSAFPLEEPYYRGGSKKTVRRKDGKRKSRMRRGHIEAFGTIKRNETVKVEAAECKGFFI